MGVKKRKDIAMVAGWAPACAEVGMWIWMDVLSSGRVEGKGSRVMSVQVRPASLVLTSSWSQAVWVVVAGINCYSAMSKTHPL